MSMIRLTSIVDKQVALRASRIIATKVEPNGNTLVEYTASAMAPGAFCVFVKETPFEIADMIDKIENKGWNE
jgi:hypothetical protein